MPGQTAHELWVVGLGRQDARTSERQAASLSGRKWHPEHHGAAWDRGYAGSRTTLSSLLGQGTRAWEGWRFCGRDGPMAGSLTPHAAPLPAFSQAALLRQATAQEVSLTGGHRQPALGAILQVPQHGRKAPVQGSLPAWHQKPTPARPAREPAGHPHGCGGGQAPAAGSRTVTPVPIWV